jgi:hypothetical protein
VKKEEKTFSGPFFFLPDGVRLKNPGVTHRDTAFSKLATTERISGPAVLGANPPGSSPSAVHFFIREMADGFQASPAGP